MTREALLTVVVQSPPDHFQWLKKRTQVELTEGFRALEARDESKGPRYCRMCFQWHGPVVGMVGYCGWRPGSVMLHVAVDRASCIPKLRMCAFDYAFNIAGKAVVFGVTPGDNTRALRFNKHLGFREVMRLNEEPGQCVVVQEMRREDCRWLPKEVQP